MLIIVASEKRLRNEKLYVYAKEILAMSKSKCPTPETIGQLINNQFGKEEEKRLLIHIRDCDACTAEYALQKIMSSDDSILDEEEQ